SQLSHTCPTTRQRTRLLPPYSNRPGCAPPVFPRCSPLLLRQPPRSTLFPSTTLFRSALRVVDAPRLPPPTPEQVRALRLLEEERSEEHTSELQSRENIVCRRMRAKKDAARRLNVSVRWTECRADVDAANRCIHGSSLT